MNLNFNIKSPTQKELRKFGITLFIALSILGGLFLWKKGNISFLFFGFSGLFLFVGLSNPNYLRYIYIFWMKLAALMGFIVNHFILYLIYYLIFTPIGLTMRLFGRNPLLLKVDKNKKSYWIKKQNARFLKEKYEKMF
jgi:hypothetical protein